MHMTIENTYLYIICNYVYIICIKLIFFSNSTLVKRLVILYTNDPVLFCAYVYCIIGKVTSLVIWLAVWSIFTLVQIMNLELSIAYSFFHDLLIAKHHRRVGTPDDQSPRCSCRQFSWSSLNFYAKTIML